ncbi:WD40-repeat-containing domain protein [Pterulicium gracile]|uniref:WD40-repeat-containing domain protein n=1 Tax=Pterulicium gracile TaxID=1884261 RepID=A0A5C3QBI5_9AGAR|nr:WD40-repeat-containing domain protein [Pterula gracilis]
MHPSPEELSDALQGLPSHERVSYLSHLLQSLQHVELVQIYTRLGLSPHDLFGDFPKLTATTFQQTPLPPVDHFSSLPTELLLHILSHFAEPQDLLSLGQSNKRLNRTINGSSRTWRGLCYTWGFISQDHASTGGAARNVRHEEPLEEMEKFADLPLDPALEWITARKREHLSRIRGSDDAICSEDEDEETDLYKAMFIDEYVIQRNWRRGGRVLRSHSLCNDSAVVTASALSKSWLVTALANAKIHVLSATTGILLRTLVGHDSGVWTVWLISAGGAERVDGYKHDARAEMTPKEQKEEDKKLGNLSPYLRKAVGLHDPGTPPDTPPPPSGELGEDEHEDGTDSKCCVSRGFGQPHALVLSGGCDKVLKVWDIRTGYCIYTLVGHATTIRCLGVLSQTSLAVTGSRDGIAIVWDVKMGRLVRKLRGHDRSVRCIAVGWVKSGYRQRGLGTKRVITGSYDSTCRVWDLDTGDCLHVLRGHVADIFCLAFDGLRVASAGSDTTVRLWNVLNGECLAILSGHTSLICTLHLSPRALCSGSSDGRVIMFDLPPYPPPIHDQDEHCGSSSDDTSNASIFGLPLPKPVRRHVWMQGVPEHVSSQGMRAKYQPEAEPYRKLFSGLAHPNFSVTSVQFGGRAGCRFLVTSGNDGLVKVWRVPEPENDEAKEKSSPDLGSSGVGLSSSSSSLGKTTSVPDWGKSTDWNKEFWIRNLTPHPSDGTVLTIDQSGAERRVNGAFARDDGYNNGERGMDTIWKVVWRGGTCAVMGRMKGRSVVEIWSFRQRVLGTGRGGT